MYTYNTTDACMYVRSYVCVCAHACGYMYVWVGVFPFVYACMCTYIHMCMYVLHMHTCVSVPTHKLMGEGSYRTCVYSWYVIQTCISGISKYRTFWGASFILCKEVVLFEGLEMY